MNDLIQLSEICSALGMTERVAKDRAAAGRLPFPAFKLSGTRKGPWFVKKDDLDSWIKAKSDTASKLHSKMRSASGV